MNENLPQPLHPLALKLQLVQSEWGMSHAQMAALLHVSVETYEGWLAGKLAEQTSVTLPREMETAAPLIAIHQRLSARFGSTSEQAQWLTQKNHDFGGNPPLDIAASSIENLRWVAYYLDSSMRT